jgi:hypothetical protein
VGRYLELADEALRGVPSHVPDRADLRRCAGCGRDGFTAMIVSPCGDHLCRDCRRETTRLPDVRQPSTPMLDGLMARVEGGDSGDAA